MKKFNPDQELEKMQNKSLKSNGSGFNNVLVPLLVVACSCLAMIGVTFSTRLADDTKEMYTVTVEILGNGKNETFERRVEQGPFRSNVVTNSSFGSISCTEGSLNYDALTSTISSVYVNSDISCVLSFMDDGTKNLSFDSLGTVNDDKGTSYYYRVDAKNNFVKINDLLFRIVRINGDGSIRLVLNDVVLSSNYGNTNEYTSSNVKKTLDEWYKANIEGLDYVVEGTYDNLNYESYETDSLLNMFGYYVGKVGTLSVKEVEIMTKGVEDNANFLNTVNGFYLMNGSGPNNVHYYKNGKVLTIAPTNVLSLRPVINVNDVNLVGEGTVDNPYLIEK